MQKGVVMSDRIWVATRKGLFRIDRGDGGWRIGDAKFLGDNLPLVARDPRDGAIYAAFGHGHFGIKLHRSNDDGKTFEEIAAPAYPEKPGGAKPIMNPMFQKEVPWNVEMIWSLAFGSDQQPGRIWCGTIPGGLFVSDDRGATWSLNQPLLEKQREHGWMGGGYDWPGLHSICVDPRDHDRIVVAVSTGGCWQTRDGGASWEVCSHGLRADYVPPEEDQNPVFQDAHLLVQCRSSPDYFWIQHHNGIFRSTDDSASWSEMTDVKPSAFGFAVAVHPDEPGTAWFVPARKDEFRYPIDGKVVVNRTRDGGKSFETLTNGLPQEHAYDLTFRHALDIDESGNRLAFGSTTGSLWVSEDQGDSWQTVSSHLPPVHAVRFM